MQTLLEALLSILPPVGMAVLVYFLFKGIIGADAKERKVRAQIEAEERAKHELAGQKRSPIGEQPE
ncbi:MAG: hypothetical protein JHD31_02540 [Rhodoluna sp.]|jgi:hypothetical protein|nr:hypothetical protein [Rhodoluna sp.]